jgi:hypothetical protein
MLRASEKGVNLEGISQCKAADTLIGRVGQDYSARAKLPADGWAGLVRRSGAAARAAGDFRQTSRERRRRLTRRLRPFSDTPTKVKQDSFR